MAKAPAKPEVAATDAPAPKKSKLMIIIVVIVVLLLLIAAALVGVLLLVKGKNSGDSAEATPAVQAAPTVDLSKPPVFVQLDTFTVNLAREETDHYLQAVIVLRVADATIGAQLNGFMPEIRHRINLLLSSKMPSEVSTMEGREKLAQEILTQVNSALGFNPPANAAPGTAVGPVQGVLFNSFIIQ